MKKQKEKKVVKDVKSFVVDRSKWLRGEGFDDSCLLTTGNRMCCLGFYAEACGLDRKTIRNIQSPSGVVQLTHGEESTDKNGKFVSRKSDVIWDTKLVDDGTHDTATCNHMMEINDDADIDDEKESLN